MTIENKHMQPNTPPKFVSKPVSENTQKLLALSFEECENLTERDLHCPICAFPIEGVFSDLVGHIRVKCQKCKAVLVLNPAYFRRMKGYGKYKEKYYEKRKNKTE